MTFEDWYYMRNYISCAAEGAMLCQHKSGLFSKIRFRLILLGVLFIYAFPACTFIYISFWYCVKVCLSHVALLDDTRIHWYRVLMRFSTASRYALVALSHYLFLSLEYWWVWYCHDIIFRITGKYYEDIIIWYFAFLLLLPAALRWSFLARPQLHFIPRLSLLQAMGFTHIIFISRYNG